ncbi:tubulin-folding cofactor B like protein [Danaus plexippus plexippus]|uniref:Tubulin-folding cofactor B like protein n=1 Tax=Danaus plexippus plexippus TaxID=278856 RepID=A0A212EXN0_DANPL|nr:tubulin-folding cofactor B like protein [Danaus plexippus plexippus]
MEGIQIITQDFVNVHITKSGGEDAAPIERRFKKEISIQDFKTKLELLTGGSAVTMKLKLYDNKNNYIGDLDNDQAMIGSYPIEDGMRIHVIDNFSLVKDFDTSDTAERFRLSEEEYEKKGDTLRSFLQRNKLGKYNEEEMNKMREQQQKEMAEEAERAAAAVVGARCEVNVPGAGPRRATVRYNGPLDGARGLWIGVQYDEPRGKNDGEVNGKRYFTCPPKYGGFVKPVYVTVGDFPEEETGLEDEI